MPGLHACLDIPDIIMFVGEPHLALKQADIGQLGVRAGVRLAGDPGHQ